MSFTYPYTFISRDVNHSRHMYTYCVRIFDIVAVQLVIPKGKPGIDVLRVVITDNNGKKKSGCEHEPGKAKSCKMSAE